MEQTTQNTASTHRTISQTTEALITAKCRIFDLFDDVYSAMELLYGKANGDEYLDVIYEKLKPIRDLVDGYIIESIDCKIGSGDGTEI